MKTEDFVEGGMNGGSSGRGKGGSLTNPRPFCCRLFNLLILNFASLANAKSQMGCADFAGGMCGNSTIPLLTQLLIQIVYGERFEISRVLIKFH